MDLAIPNYFTGNIVWLEAGAGGTWQSHTVGTPASSLSGCELIDVNGDGLSDLVATWLAPGGGQMVWLENPGNGGSWPSHAVSAPFTVEESTQLTVLDLDGDGRDDLMHSVLDSLGYRNHLVYRNTGIGLAIANNLGIGADPTLPIPGDYDGDGDLDVAFPFTGSNVTYWVQNQSTPGTIAFAGYTALPSFSLGIALDADQDGDDDLLCHIPSGPQWDGLAWSQNSAGIFAVPQSNATLPNVGVARYSTKAVDLNGDGLKDVFLNYIPAVNALPVAMYMENLGGGLFAPLTAISPFNVIAAPMARTLADMDGDGDLDLITAWDTASGPDFLRIFWNPGEFGTNLVCTSQANSTGAVAALSVTGSEHVQVGNTHLVCEQLPPATFTMFLAATGEIAGVMPAGSSGTLCLGGSIGRYNAAGQLQVSDAAGRAVLPVDLTQVPQPTGPMTVTAGQTLYFQAWFRDIVGGQQTSNFSSAQSVMFQ
ncbi:MAG: FG-GAP-like repeat-containing protein [Planctomycetota bacterium]